MKSPSDKLLNKHKNLVHSDMKKVTSHVQREDGEWFVNTIMIEDCDVPFRYKRKKLYKCIKGARVNLTYYATAEKIGGFEMEFMNVVRIKIA